MMHPVETDSDSLFSIDNLPYGAFQPVNGSYVRPGVRFGETVIDLAELERSGLFADLDTGQSKSVFSQPTLNAFLAQGRGTWTAVRNTLTGLLGRTWPAGSSEAKLLERTTYSLREVRLSLPVEVGDYTDFYSSIEHATNVGSMFRGRDNALLPNWRHIPIAYHGRSSTLILDGVPVRRPWGQVSAKEGELPQFQPTSELDFELEVGFLTGPATEAGKPVPIEDAADYIFGVVLVNDWSARDLQRWEYRPLGPFLGKNFATSLSPWVVPLAALEPFRCTGPEQQPAPLPYLQTSQPWAFDMELRATLQSAAMRDAGLSPMTLTETNFRYLYWNMAQQLAHHTSNGCALRPGDLLASGTISGSNPGSFGSMLELSWGGTRPITLPTGETRTFLEDGDRLTLSGWAEGNGHRVGLGEVSAIIQPAVNVSGTAYARAP